MKSKNKKEFINSTSSTELEINGEKIIIGFQSKKKFSKPLNKPSGNFRKNFKSKPQPLKLSDYERRKLAEQKAMKGIRGDNIQKDKENKSSEQTQNSTWREVQQTMQNKPDTG